MSGKNAGKGTTKRFTKIGDEVLQAGRSVWLAGLGALVTIEKRTKAVLDDLVSKGERFQEESELAKRLQPAAEKVKKTVEPAAQKVRQAGNLVEERVQRTIGETLHRLGLPTRDEIGTLIDRVEKLTRKVDELQKAS